MSQKAKVAVIGDENSIMIFNAVGFYTYPIEQYSDVRKKIIELEKNKFTIIFLTENVASDIEDILDEYKNQSFPIIVPIPNKDGALGIGMQAIKKNIEKAVGSDIL
ncbi:V-type ATP synthase subunit F [Pseudoramibacter sp.]|jgi:V/A-type H+-transporting ATPase subunit F|uniref:V-type ATP synthase subunit F n=1 Tax=Pseudoramibacter sp. TaxID=2034862 RepID=UPI0025CE5A2D|nr:V-type ATP synthase subunit F [Pseudoramibacter sp.]MCH4072863.1 V-type ATP synthase subunit F [Pseudoramibacter sp.]MCH4106634.1 V-type ATP synthase subunit F [Pseudoramibacter sp.]